MDLKFLSLIIPCYNEEKTLSACIEKCIKLCDFNIKLELVIVNDCSTDNSLNLAYELQKKHSDIITVLTHDVNQGKGAALRTGFMHAKGDFIGIQDADEEYNPQDYLILLDALTNNNADVAYGSRYLRTGTRKVLYFWHTLMNKGLTFISNMFTNLDTSDMETCYKLFRREIIQKIAPQLKEDRFGFEPEITALIAIEKVKFYECAISYTPRSYEEGKKITWRDGVHALYCILHYSAHVAPLPMQILLYLFIGISAALVNLFSFSLFLTMNFSSSLSIVISFVLAAIVNYFLCIKILFRHQARWSAKGEIFAYLLTILFMGSIDYAITSGLMSLDISSTWSKAWATLIGFAGNFALRKYFVF